MTEREVKIKVPPRNGEALEALIEFISKVLFVYQGRV
jgi:uncharacterized protein YggU (UPF0235/DUF167 family)